MSHPHPCLPGIANIKDEMVAIRRQIHAHPELGFQEEATSELVATKLQEWGYEVHRGLGKTGVVGKLVKGTGTKRLGIRADMDALPIVEKTGLEYASKHHGKMHACGHDGHTAILLAAAKHIATESTFDGTLHLIFQPAEEGIGGGGARQMIEDGLFDLFPCDAVFGLHNMPGYSSKQIGFLPGPFMASADTIRVTLRGKGGHGAIPHKAIDPIVAGASIITALQTIVSRNIDPFEPAVITVGSLHAGEASNVIPETAHLLMTMRAMTPATRKTLQTRIENLIRLQAESFGLSADIQFEDPYPPVVNHAAETAFAKQVLVDWLGEDHLIPDLKPLMGAEDFAYMLEQVPGCFLFVGNDGEMGGGCMIHNPGYDFNDEALPLAASYWVKLTEAFLK